MERSHKNLGEIPEAERVDINQTPVTQEEMRAAVDALKETKEKKLNRVNRMDTVSDTATAEMLKKMEVENEEVIKARHTESWEQKDAI